MNRTSSLFLKAHALVAYLLIVQVFTGTAQKKTATTFDKSVTLISENDNYLFRGSDRYYTNGIFLQYKTVHQKKGKKNIRQFEMGQMLFTPKQKYEQSDLRYFGNSYPANTIDRPFCGYLYVKYSNFRFLSKAAMYQWGVSLGTIGNPSGGEQTQKMMHNLVGVYDVAGWENQLQNNFLLNFQGSYSRQLLNKKIGVSQIKIIPTGTLNIGNAYDNAGLACNFAFGIINDFENTTLLNAELGGDGTLKKKYEFFIYFQPRLTFQAYNATIQENLFSKSNAITNRLEAMLYEHRIAAVFSKNRLGLSIGYVFQTRELKLQELNHRFATVQLCYRFK